MSNPTAPVTYRIQLSKNDDTPIYRDVTAVAFRNGRACQILQEMQQTIEEGENNGF